MCCLQGTVRMGLREAALSPEAPGKELHWDLAAQEAHQRCCTLSRELDDCGRSGGAVTLLKGSTEAGVWRSGVWRMEEGFSAGQDPGGVAGGAEECAAGVLPCSEPVWSHWHHTVVPWAPWPSAVGCGVKCVQNGRHALPREGAACHGQTAAGSPCFRALVCSCTPPWPHQSGPTGAAQQQRSLISLGARSRCADALFPAPNSQQPALTTAFLGQLREGLSSQDCLTCSVNVTLPWALLPAGSWPWMPHH